MYLDDCAPIQFIVRIAILRDCLKAGRLGA
jgi:hypothetical protein